MPRPRRERGSGLGRRLTQCGAVEITVGIASGTPFTVYLAGVFDRSLQGETSISATIIVVEDDPRMGRVLTRHLTRAGYAVSVAANGSEMRRLFRHEGADLVLLDLNLGSEDGMDLARELVDSTPAAVMIVTGRDDLQDRIDGLDAGADDYITKPFQIEELLARIRAVLRRHAFEACALDAIQLGTVTLDLSAMSVSDTSNGASLRLTETESRILATLMRQHGRAVGRAQLLNRESLTPDERTVDVHICNIRRKLRDEGILNLVIWPVRGYGYRLRLEND
ncbi:DNA-binding response regulator [Thiocapsa imhoffii]|uniref:DNA-binding response regulator n=1 Tax=Thiocapsa imhoffii TaxID=382777 RepID=A0A9X0WGG5_9GAMM|nr:response regulator transcription factor [Thiocapsa imhoffii]MBK1644145.1 DNA-binding response regulator [Thiocapsa imhoffii]